MKQHYENGRVELHRRDGGTVCIRYRDSSDVRALEWTMSEALANDVRVWWETEGRREAGHVTAPKTTVRGCAQIALCAGAYVSIRELDARGRPSMVGWTLPLHIVAALAVWLSPSSRQERGTRVEPPVSPSHFSDPPTAASIHGET
jgi:hypothetical protein